MKNDEKARSEKALKNLLKNNNKLTLKIIKLQREIECLTRKEGA